MLLLWEIIFTRPSPTWRFYCYGCNASNNIKFSRHVILHLYNIILFRNQYEGCRFVEDFNSNIFTFFTNSGSIKVVNIMIKHKAQNIIIEKTFIDLGVYKSRQQFRVVGSSKCKDDGKRSLKLMTLMNSCIYNIMGFDHLIFIKTLISYKDSNVKYEQI